MIETFILAVLAVAYMVFREHTARVERRAVAADRKAELEALRDEFAAERAEWARERGLLLNRIKPETAQPVLPADAETFEAVAPWDDDGYWEHKKTLAGGSD